MLIADLLEVYNNFPPSKVYFDIPDEMMQELLDAIANSSNWFIVTFYRVNYFYVFNLYFINFKSLFDNINVRRLKYFDTTKWTLRRS